MSEGSVPRFEAFKSNFLPFLLAKRAAGRLKSRFRGPRTGRQYEPDVELRSRAGATIQEHAEEHAALFERAERLRKRAERLEEEGTPSDSAHNRAARAEAEIVPGLRDLRAAFAASTGSEEGRIAFDREIELRYPALKLANGRS